MSIASPPRPRDPTRPTRLAEPDPKALIEEARQRRRRRRRRNIGYALLTGAFGLVTYMGVVRGSAQGESAAPAGTQRIVATQRFHPHNGPLTMFLPGRVAANVGSSASIATVGQGKARTLWHCPGDNFCGQVVSFDWAPDGRRVAFSLDEIGGTSSYVGLHVVNITTGRDRQIPAGAPSQGTPGPLMQRYVQKMRDRVGCWPVAEIDWSPDGTRLAYSCGKINVLDLNGSGFKTVPTRSANAFWPSWSPTGTRIAYSTGLEPNAESKVFTIRPDGSQRRLLATGGAAPAWAPDGKTIAYQTPCGIQLMTPDGHNVTPHPKDLCGAVGPSGPPVWSPDGQSLAVETKNGIYTMSAQGRSLNLVSPRATRTWYGALPGRPSWQPVR